MMARRLVAALLVAASCVVSARTGASAQIAQTLIINADQGRDTISRHIYGHFAEHLGRGIYDGDIVWVNPERPYQIGKVVLALVSDVSGEAGMVVKTYAHTDVGECLLSETSSGRSPVVCREFKVIGPVVGITSWRLPS